MPVEVVKTLLAALYCLLVLLRGSVIVERSWPSSRRCTTVVELEFDVKLKALPYDNPAFEWGVVSIAD